MTDPARFDAVNPPTDPGLYWPIKRAFIAYVLRIADGQVMGSPGVTVVDSGTFVFAPVEHGDEPPHQPADDDTVSEADGALAFRGELRLQAHNGALGVRIANPRVEFGSDGSAERARVLIDDPDGSTRSVPLATFVAAAEGDDTGLRRWTGTDVRLAAEAISLFGGYYGEGEVFDDLTIVAAPR